MIADDALAADDLALVANLLDARADLHALSSCYLCRYVMRPAARVVGGHLDGHAVAREDPDVELPHPAADRGEHDQAVVALHAEHRVRQRLLDDAVELELVALRLFALATFSS